MKSSSGSAGYALGGFAKMFGIGGVTSNLLGCKGCVQNVQGLDPSSPLWAVNLPADTVNGESTQIHVPAVSPGGAVCLALHIWTCSNSLWGQLLPQNDVLDPALPPKKRSRLLTAQRNPELENDQLLCEKQPLCRNNHVSTVLIYLSTSQVEIVWSMILGDLSRNRQELQGAGQSW